MEGSGGQQPKKPDGERWLEVLGYGGLKNFETTYLDDDGNPILVKDFHKLCGKDARPVFATLENTDKTNPKYDLYLRAARNLFKLHFPKPFEEGFEPDQ